MIQRLLSSSKQLTKSIRFNYLQDWDQHFIRPLNLKAPTQFKNIYKQHPTLRPFPKVRANFYDVLYMPGLDKQRLLDIQQQLLTKGQIGLSNQFIAMLMYHLAKNRLMLKDSMDIIQEWIPRHKGEYTSRQIFGCLYGSIIYNRMDYVGFFLDQVQASSLEFSLSESLQIIQALNQNKHMSLQEKHRFWQDNFKKAFIDNMFRLNSGRLSTIFRICDAFKQFEHYDEDIWDRIITMMDNKTGWARTKIIQRLYPLTGTFQKAKLLFDKYYLKLSTNRNIQWRYNLEQLRLYSSQQMIAKSQEDIQMYPTFRTMLPKDKLKGITQKYERWLTHGAVKQEEEIIRDKSASFGYAIKDRFQSLTKDNVDFSKLTKKQFEELFGTYDQEMMKQKQQVPESQQQTAVQEEQNKS